MVSEMKPPTPARGELPRLPTGYDGLYLENNGYNPQPLGDGTLKGRLFQEGGGYKVNWGGDRLLQYHPPGGRHHGGYEYYKISTGTTGTRRFDIYGNLID